MFVVFNWRVIGSVWGPIIPPSYPSERNTECEELDKARAFKAEGRNSNVFQYNLLIYAFVPSE